MGRQYFLSDEGSEPDRNGLNSEEVQEYKANTGMTHIEEELAMHIGAMYLRSCGGLDCRMFKSQKVQVYSTQKK